VPVRNGSFPEAPDGGQRSHVGTLLDAVPVALPADPAELVEAEGVDRAPVRAVEAADDIPVVPPPAADPVPVPPVAGGEPVVVAPVAVEDDGCAVVVVAVFAPIVAGVEPAALLPSVTTPRLVAAYGFAAVCAMAGTAAAKKNSAA
jgi:hypothetical protein